MAKGHKIKHIDSNENNWRYINHFSVYLKKYSTTTLIRPTDRNMSKVKYFERKLPGFIFADSLGWGLLHTKLQIFFWVIFPCWYLLYLYNCNIESNSQFSHFLLTKFHLLSVTANLLIYHQTVCINKRSIPQ